MKLGIDTTNNNLCYALIGVNNSVLFSENIYPCSNAAEILAPKITDMLWKFAITVSDITHIISVTGPGGFSGVRIGTAFVTGLVAGSAINVIGITSLQAAALSVVNPQPNSIIIACLNARRDGVYIAIFNHDYKRLTPDKVINTNDFPHFLESFQTQSYYVSGHGRDIIKPFLNDALGLGTIDYPLAQEFTQKVNFMTDRQNNQPIYLRMPDATVSQKR